MATKCCLGGNECNHVISIGYLKSFVGNYIQSSLDGSILSVNNSDDTYCPTYDELTSGILVQNHSNGSTPNGDTDGIIINGSYSGNQLVNQKDLELVYTRFKSLTVSANGTNGLDPCGDSSTLSYAHIYTRYTRAMTNDCETVESPFDAVTITSVDINDTADSELTWSIAPIAYGNISYPIYSIGKNNDGSGTSQSRYDDVSATIIFRGTNHDSNIVRITQNGLGGSFVKWKNEHTEYYSYDNYTITPSIFDCNGGNWEGTGYYTRQDWWVYRWMDDCNTYYDDITINDDYTYTQKTEAYGSGTVTPIDCSSITSHEHREGSETWHGHTATWMQDCEPCSDCSSLSLSPTSMTWTYDSTSQQTATYSFNSASVVIKSVSCSDTTNFNVTHNSNNKEIIVKPNSINETLTARTATVTLTYDTTAQNDCTKTIEIEQGVQSCDCDSLGLNSTSITWSAWNDAAAKAVSYTANSVCVSNISVSSSTEWFTASVNISTNVITVRPSGNNNTTSAKDGIITVHYKSNGIDCSKPINVLQPGYVCSCDDLTLGSAPSAWAWNETTAKTVSFTANSICITSVSANSSDNWFTASVNGNTISVTPSGQNATTNAKTSTITVSYASDGNPCSKTFNISQNSYGCTCDDLTLGSAPSAWAWTETETKTVTFTANSICITDVSVSSDNSWFSTSLNGDTISVSPSGQNTASSARNAIITLSYKSNGTNCSKTFNVSQGSNTCSCDDLSIVSTPSSWAWDATTSKTARYTINSLCITDVSVTSSNNWFSVSNSLNGSNGTITVTPSGNNDTTIAKTATITISYKSNGSNCSKTFNVEQNPYGCSCGDLSVTSTPSNWAWDATAAKTASYTINTTCITNISVACDNNWFSVSNSLNGSNGTVTVTPSGNNTTLTAKTGTITISYKSNGSNCSKTFNVEQNPYGCSCDDLTLTTTSLVWSSWNDTTTKTATYTANETCITDISVSSSTNWFSASVNTSTKVISVVPSGQNETTSAKTSVITVSYKSNGANCSKTINVSQPGYGCSCGDLVLGSAPGTWTWNDTAAKTMNFTANTTCITDVSVSSDNSWFSVSLNGNTISVSPSGQNTTTSAKEATITVSYKSNGTNCSQRVNVEQGTEACTCNSVSVSPTSLSWNWDDTSSNTKEVAVTSANCITSIKLAGDYAAHFNVTLGANKVTVSPKGQNTTLNSYSGTVNVNYSFGSPLSSCTKTVTLTQGTQACSCADLSIDLTELSWAYDEHDQKTKTYSAPTCITNLTAVSNNNWFSVDYSTSGQIKVTPSGNNTTMTAKTGTITVSYTANGGSPSSCTRTFDVRQGTEACSCDSVSVSPTSCFWAWNSTTANTQEVTVTSANCITSVELTGDYATHFNATLGANKVTVSPKGQNTTISNYEGTLNVKYSFGSPLSSCTKSVTLTQGNQGCSCTALTISEDGLSWGSTETTAKTRTYTLVDAACVNNVTATLGGTDSNKFTMSLNTSTKTLTVTPVGTNATLNAYNAQINFSYSVNGIAEPCTATIPLTQNGTSCGCGDFTMSTADMELDCFSTGGTRTFTLGLCNTIGTVTSSNAWFTTSVNGNTITVRTSGTNDSGSQKTATITVNYTANGSACTAKTFTVKQASCNPCDNISGLPSSIDFNAS